MKKKMILLSCLLVSGGMAWGCNDDSASLPISPLCGNGVLDDGESCDDGNIIDEDGCSGICQVEAGWKCEHAGEPCVKEGEEPDNPDDPVVDPSKCGNGVLDEGEGCDLGEDNGRGAGCSEDCKIEPGWICETGVHCERDPGVAGVCGDGKVDEGEVCDTEGRWGCAPDCSAVEEGYACTGLNIGEYTVCKRMDASSCGDMEKDAWEMCDPSVEGTVEGTYGLSADGTPLCTQDCQYAQYCGDGVVSEMKDPATGIAYEACDRGAANDDEAYGPGQCLKNCKVAPYCGDGKFQPEKDELCDPADEVSNGGCTDDCKVKDGYKCNETGFCWLKTAEESDECLGAHPDYKGCGAVDKCEVKKAAMSGKVVSGRVVEPDLGEECDQAGNGCSDTCKAEEGWKCVKTPGRVCKECSYEEGKQCVRRVYEHGNGVVEADGDEECDDGNVVNGDGCSSEGRKESGYSCICGKDGLAYSKTNPQCVCQPVCGDGVRTADEECDDGNTVEGDGCDSICRIESGASCTVLDIGKKSECKGGFCGDGKVGHGEICDDGDGKNVKTTEGSGCSKDCKSVETGWKCPASGGKCVLEQCGNGVATPAGWVGKQCDLGDKNGLGKGCDSSCRLEPGYASCNNSKKDCTALTTCGNGKIEAGEECDDGNKVGGDGCSKDCRIESIFECSGEPSVCRPVCGDGIWMHTLKDPATGKLYEECDLGKDNGKGKGCSLDCKIETGWTCTKPVDVYPSRIHIPVTFRDMRFNKVSGTGAGYQTQAWIDNIKAKDYTSGKACSRSDRGYLTVGWGHPDFERFGGQGCSGMLGEVGSARLSADGKPVFLTTRFKNGTCPNGPSGQSIYSHYLCPATFDTWYRTDSMNMEVPWHLELKQDETNKDTYVFNSAGQTGYCADGKTLMSTNGQYFSPLTNAGFNKGIKGTNGGFTSELHTTFQFNGKQAKLDFKGDDDVWAFVNGRLFVDLGGMQSGREASATLSVEECSDGKGGKVKCNKTYDLWEGGVYDLHVFQAERMSSGSNYKLTLAGFIPPLESKCSSTCGDGIVAIGAEECDYKNAAENALLGCVNCHLKPVCGNGILEAGESCDKGQLCKDDKYKALCDKYGLKFVDDASCSDTCKFIGATCGNGVKEGAEECDDGAKNGTAESTCMTNCRVSRCGDGIVDIVHDEECDLGANNGKGRCSKECKLARCGDGIVQPEIGEVCDDGAAENTGEYGKCLSTCTGWTARCGDGIPQPEYGEECDNGVNDGSYGTCTKECKKAPHCGDGILQEEYGEQCDFGTDNGTDKRDPTNSFTCSKACRKTSVVA